MNNRSPNWLHPVSLLLFALLVTACAARLTSTPTAPTSRDVQHDRVLVTLYGTAPAGIAGLSPSGRLDYQPPDMEQVRAAQLRAAEQLAARFDLQIEEEWEIPSLDVHCFVFRLSDVNQRRSVMAKLREQPGVESAQPLQFFHGQAENTVIQADVTGLVDPLASWDAKLNERLAAVHRHATGKSVSIAVIDSGVDAGHEDLQGAALHTLDFVDSRSDVPPETHGTAVVGLLSARHENGVGIRGYAPDAEVLLIRACWERAPGEPTVCNSFTLAKALSVSIESGVDIVNLSISGPRDPLLERLADEMTSRGQWLVAAGETSYTFPGSVTNSILATRYANSASDTSAALTLLPGNRYGMRDGTSISAARITGAAALTKQIRPSITQNEFQQLLLPVNDSPSELLSSDALLEVARLFGAPPSERADIHATQ